MNGCSKNSNNIFSRAPINTSGWKNRWKESHRGMPIFPNGLSDVLQNNYNKVARNLK